MISRTLSNQLQSQYSGHFEFQVVFRIQEGTCFFSVGPHWLLYSSQYTFHSDLETCIGRTFRVLGCLYNKLGCSLWRNHCEWKEQKPVCLSVPHFKHHFANKQYFDACFGTVPLTSYWICKTYYCNSISSLRIKVNEEVKSLLKVTSCHGSKSNGWVYFLSPLSYFS